MKYLLTTLSMCLIAIATTAQNKADIEVSYSEISFYENGVERSNKYHLLAMQGSQNSLIPGLRRLTH